MSRIENLRIQYEESLIEISKKNEVNYSSIELLLNAEKTKKFLKKKASIQEVIDREIEKSI